MSAPLNGKRVTPVKLTRPAVAAATVAILAASAVPHVADQADAPGPVIQAADEKVLTSVKEVPEEAPAAEKAPEEEVGDGKVEGAAEPSISKKPAELPQGDSEPVTDENLPDPEPVPEAEPTDPPVRALNEAPKTYKGEPQRWYSLTKYGALPHGEALEVKSESMERYIPIAFFRAHDANNNIVDNAPTIYLLNGAGGSEQNTDWVAQALPQMVETFRGQGVNVVVPMEGAFSYYVDWAAEPPVSPEESHFYKGKQMWSTFLAKELPQAIERYAKANDKRAVAGLSMAATSTLLLAEHNPGFYQAVGSYSGCAATSTPLPNFFVGLTVNRGASSMTPDHVFGPMGSDYNRYNDALVNAAQLKGTKVYLSTGTGLAAESDMAGTLAKRLKDTGQYSDFEASSVGSAKAYTLQVEGGVIEAAMNACTHDLIAKMQGNGMKRAAGEVIQSDEDFVAELRNVGTHSWPVWKDDLKLSFDRVFKPALGL